MRTPAIVLALLALDDLRRQLLKSTRDLAKLATRIAAMDRGANPRRP